MNQRIPVLSSGWIGWDPGHRVIRSQVWATHLSGSKTALQEWIRTAAERAERRG